MTPLPDAPRLRFRKYTPADQANVTALFADPAARAFYPQMHDPDAVRRWIDWSRENYRAFGYGLWALERKDTGAFVGDCGLTWQAVLDGRELEIGYHVVAAERRQGYAVEAARACLDFALTHTDARLVCSIVSRANAASAAVARRIHSSCRDIERNGQPAWMFFTRRAV